MLRLLISNTDMMFRAACHSASLRLQRCDGPATPPHEGFHVANSLRYLFEVQLNRSSDINSWEDYLYRKGAERAIDILRAAAQLGGIRTDCRSIKILDTTVEAHTELTC